MSSLLGALASDWTENYEQDRVFYPVAACIMAVHSLKLATRDPPVMSATANLQQLILFAILACTAALTRLAPGLYRRRSPALRLLFLLVGYGMPRFGSPHALDPPITGPSHASLLGVFLDGFYLWQCTRCVFLGFACVGCRPPLYLALPLQLAGVWRVQRVGYCSTEVLQHPVMQRRTVVTHEIFAFLLEALLGMPYIHVVSRSGPEQRCKSMLLFCSLLSSVLLPLLLLLPPAQRNGGGHGDDGRAAEEEDAAMLTPTARLESCLRRLLSQLLLRPPTNGRRRPEAGAGQWQQQQQPCSFPAALAALAARWAVVLIMLWAFSCAAYMM